MLRGRVDDAFEFGFARGEAALGELGLLGLTLQAALLLTAIVQAALGIDDGLIQLRMTLLAVGQLHVELFEAGFSGGAAFLQIGQLGFHFRQITTDLLAARTRLLSQLAQAQGLHLQLVRSGLCGRGLGADADQALR